MKVISHLLAFLLATMLAATVSSWILEQTLWSATYIEKQATDTQLYAKLSTAVPAAFAEADPEAAKSAQTVLDPGLIQSQTESLLPQFIDHIHNGGPAPTVNLETFASAIGQPAPDGQKTQTLSFGSADANIVQTGQKLRTAGAVAPWAALGLIVFIIAVMKSRRWPTLSRAAFDTAVGLALIGGLFLLVPQFLAQALSKPTLTPIRDAAMPFGTTLFHGLAGRFGLAAIIFLALAIGLWLVGHAARLKDKFMPKSKKPPQAPPAASIPSGL